MPIYEYACQDCDHRLDALQKVSEAALVHCPECGKPALRRLLSAPRFRLKGKGWYETDFKTDNQRNLHGDKAPAKKKDTDKSGDKAKSNKSKEKKTSKADSS